MIIKRPGGLGSWRTGRDYPNDSIAKNGQNPETSPGNLRRLAVTQMQEKNHQLTLMRKNHKDDKFTIIVTTLTLKFFIIKFLIIDNYDNISDSDVNLNGSFQNTNTKNLN